MYLSRLSTFSFYICMKDVILSKDDILHKFHNMIPFGHLHNNIEFSTQTLNMVITIYKTLAKPDMENNDTNFLGDLLSYIFSTSSITYYYILCVNCFRCVGLATPLGWTAVYRVLAWELVYRTLTLSST